MKVYYVWSAQGCGSEDMAASLDEGKEKLKKMILDHQNGHDDTDPWNGWSWWQHGNKWCFGGEESRVAEGTVTEFDLVLNYEDPLKQFAASVLSGDPIAIDAVRDILKI